MISSPKLSNGGIWFPVSADAVTRTNSGGLANFTSLIQLTPGGAYGLAATGWAVTAAASGEPLKISMAILAPDGAGGVKVDTGTYVSDPLTEGGGSVIVADFNGDGRQDIVMVAHNEGPIVAKTGYAFMSNAQGGFTKVALPGVTTAHDAQLFYVSGKPAIVTGTFDGDANPIYTYDNGAWVEHLSPSLATPGFGQDSALAGFGPEGAYRLVRGDVYFDYISPGVAAHIDIAVYGFDTATLGLTAGSRVDEPLQRITPYLSTLSQYQDTVSTFGKGLTHVHRLLTEDLNHDGQLDIIALQSMWSATGAAYPSALQVLQNKGDGNFVDKTASLNPDMPLATDELDYSPTFIDLDHSGINTLLFDSGTYQGASRQSNYLLLNDGTGRLYVALHDQFVALNVTVTDYVKANYTSAQNYYVGDSASQFARFIGLPQADGSINYVAQLSISHQEAPDIWRTGVVYVNVPLAYNPTTDFTTNVTIGDRNGSALMRTWAGDDTITDVGGAARAHIDGGAGEDTASYAGDFAQYRLAANGDGSISVSALAGAPHVVNDTLINIETLKFTDKTLDTDAFKTVSDWFGSVLREDMAGSRADFGLDTAVALGTGQETQAQALAAIIKEAVATTSVATLAYEFFTGKIPSELGIDYLVSPTGPNPTGNINGPLYNYFNPVNRYINFAMNLGRNGEAKDSFAAEYGSLTLFEATRKAYGVIFGATPNDAKVTQLLDGRIDFLASFSGDPAEGIGTKAAMVGFLLAAAATESVGVMAKANEAWLTDLADGSAPFAINILDPAKGYYNADYIFGG